MNKKRDLKIDTQFFDDNLNGIAIPQAILIAPAVSQQNLIKSGLNSDDSNYQLCHSHDNISFSVEMIQKVMSRKLVDRFIWCWEKLKNWGRTIDENRRSIFQQSKHRRLSPEVSNIAIEQGRSFQIRIEQSDIEKDRLAFAKVNSSEEERSNLEWLNRNHKIDIVNSKRIIVTNERSNNVWNDHLEMQRANILKEIVQKLKRNRTQANQVSNEFQRIRQSHNIISKVGKLERLVQNMNWHPPQCYQDIHNNTNRSKSSNDEQGQNVTDQIRLQMTTMRRDIQQLRKQNEQFLKAQTNDREHFYQQLAKKQEQNVLQIFREYRKQQLYKRQQELRINETKLQIQKTYQILNQQIENLKRIKIDSHISNNQSASQNFQRQKYQTQITRLQSQLQQLQSTKLKKLPAYSNNHSQYYQQILKAIPQNDRIMRQDKPAVYYLNQINRSSSRDPFSRNQSNLRLQRQKIIENKTSKAIYAQQYEDDCFC